MTTTNQIPFPFDTSKLAISFVAVCFLAALIAASVTFGWHAGRILASRVLGPTQNVTLNYDHVICKDDG